MASPNRPDGGPSQSDVNQVMRDPRPVMHPAVIFAMVVTVAGAAILVPQAGAADNPSPRLKPELIQASQQSPNDHLLAAGLMERIPAGPNAPRSRGLYSVAVVPGVPDVGIPTRTVELAATAQGTNLYRTTDTTAPAQNLARELLAVDHRLLLPFVRLEHVPPGTRYLRIAVMRPDGQPQGVGFLMEGTDPARQVLFDHIDKRVGNILHETPGLSTVAVPEPSVEDVPGNDPSHAR